MSGKVIGQTVPVVILLMLASGCAGKYKERISILEEANRNLTERLNQAHGELEAAFKDRDVLDQRLQEALGEVDALKERLAAAPEREEPPAGWTSVPGGAMIAIEGRVLFAPGKATLRKEARSTLDAVRSTVEGQYADKDILVFGHTDDQPIKKSGWADNYQLSTERALAVVRYLRDGGVDPKRLVACGCGEHRPRVPNSSPSNRAVNRRVEIYALDPQLYGLNP